MFRKSIPVILGALLIGTSSEATVVIKCPLTYNLNNLNINGQDFTLNFANDLNMKFAKTSKVELVEGSDQMRAICAYHVGGPENEGLFTLSFVSNLNCYVHGHNVSSQKGKPGEHAPSSCSGSDDCRIVTCD